MKRKNLNQLTKLEAERQSKQVAGEIAEELEATGQDSEIQAAKWVIEKDKTEEKEEKEKIAEAEWKATDAKGKIFTYRDVILAEMKRQMIENYAGLPQGFIWYPVKDKGQGIVLYVRDPKGLWYARGMKISMVPAWDIKCIERLIDKALWHMDSLDQKYIKEKEEPKIVV